MVAIGNVEIWDARNNFITGAGLTAMASYLEPSALPLAGLLATMIADPDSMSRGAREWRNEEGEDSQSRPDIGRLREDLRGQLAALESNEHLKGRMLTTVKQKFVELDGQLDGLDKAMKGVGDSLGSACQLYTVASFISLAMGGAALTLAKFSAAARANPVAMAAIQPTVTGIMGTMSRTAQKVFDVLVKLNWKVAAIFTGVGYLVAGTQQKFPGMQAIAIQAPDFTKAKVAFDGTTGGLTDPLPDVDDMPKTPSFMPPMTI
ncbi:hypothetical protein IL992_06455 [Microbispora sp. NEAU-D428]|uniref:hypothetical protein n=1 Tax=Microbispora sitophila TaxID=2771537 RepID=UPI001867DCF6|nr:hypothetical protein [Microbispora sitophila]MBE3008829.1 hypothetical protein [Microbispora sitophila]